MSENDGKKKTACIVSHSHWDREWRYSLWETRFWLLDWFDELIPLIEEGKMAGFVTDGQAAPVLDYLEVRPEMTDRVKKLVSAGKLEIGPWLYLPDEYPVDGEALVRNLVWGHRKAAELGGVLKSGYTPFGWGQTAQLPQIYAGFGIDNMFFSKRVRPERAPQSEFLWEGPDGTRLLTSRYGKGGRANFYCAIHLLGVTGMHYSGDEWRYDWSNGGVAYHRADPERMEQDHFLLNSPKQWYPDAIAQEDLDRVWAGTDESVVEDHRLMNDGFDYAFGDPLLHEIIAHINKLDEKGRIWKHTTFMDYVRVLRENVDRDKLKIVKGEMRDGPAAFVSGNALATRCRLKRRNKLAQNKLIRTAEPMSAYSALLGAEYPEHMLKEAWSNLLASHPHDSINGVTQDTTADSVMGRLHQCMEISDAVQERSLREIVKRINLAELEDNDIAVVVFNPLPYARSEVVEAWVNVPGTRPQYKYWTRRVDDIVILDDEGNPVPTQWRTSEYVDLSVAEGHIRVFPFNSIRHQLYFDTGRIPPGGYKVFKVGTKDQRKPGVPYSDLRATSGSILQAPHIAENEYVRVEMNPNGTFNVTDKELGKTFENLNYFEDSGEPGSYWADETPGYDEVYTSLGCSARLWSEENGPLQTTLFSEIVMELPADTNDETSRRTKELKAVTIRTAVTVKKGRRRIDVKVDVDNRVESHRLRVMFPTGLEGCDFSDAGGHFIVDRRPIAIQGPADDMSWGDMATLPQNNFVALSDGKTGFAVLNDSITEYEVLRGSDRTLALTLIRGVKNWICTEQRSGSRFLSQKGGQQLGEHTYRYAVYTHKGNWESANLPLLAEFFNVPVPIVQTRKHDGNLPGSEKSFFEIDNDMLRFSALKKCEDRATWVVRLYNPTSAKQKGNLVFHLPAKKAWLTSLNEEREREIPVAGNSVPLEASPCKIVTVEIET